MKYILLLLSILALTACKETTSSAASAASSGLSVSSKVSAVASNQGKNMKINIKQKLEQEPRYRRLDIDDMSENKLLRYIDKAIKRHDLLQESIKQLVQC